jgi:hypothetical protein
MIDAEVLRLRRLRETALRARAIATVLESSRHSRKRCASAAACWRIARVTTGWLRAHPYLRYQRGPSQWRSAYYGFSANVRSAMARYQGRSLQTLSLELQRVARELDDARALTWSAELSDTFGRSQRQIRQLIEELNAGARRESRSDHDTATREVLAAARHKEGGSAASNWPYLTI